MESTIVREQIDNLPLNSRDFTQLVLLAQGAVETIGSGNRDFGGVARERQPLLLERLHAGRHAQQRLIPGALGRAGFGGPDSRVQGDQRRRAGRVRAGRHAGERGHPRRHQPLPRRAVRVLPRQPRCRRATPSTPWRAQPFRRDQFGGSLGGPVRKNKTFFFFNYEGNRQSQSVTRVATVPPDEFWKGDFSSLLARGIQIRDPLAAGRPVIPNNRLDQYLGGARISKTALALQPFWGSPTQPGAANNRVSFGQDTSNRDQYTIRGDQTLPHNQSLALRYTTSTLGRRQPQHPRQRLRRAHAHRHAQRGPDLDGLARHAHGQRIPLRLRQLYVAHLL